MHFFKSFAICLITTTLAGGAEPLSLEAELELTSRPPSSSNKLYIYSSMLAEASCGGVVGEDLKRKIWMANFAFASKERPVLRLRHESSVKPNFTDFRRMKNASCGTSHVYAKSEDDFFKYATTGNIRTYAVVLGLGDPSVGLPHDVFHRLIADPSVTDYQCGPKNETKLTFSRSPVGVLAFKLRTSLTQGYNLDCVFDSPVHRYQVGTSGVVTILSEKLVPEANRDARFHLTGIERQEPMIQKRLDSLLALIPVGSRVTSNDSIEYEWNGSDVVKSIHQPSVDLAAQGRMQGRSRTILIAVAVLVVGSLLGGWLLLRRIARRTAAAGILICLCASGPFAMATEKPGPGMQYCGLYSVKCAATMLGRDLDFGSLVTMDYLSAPEGSTADDLCRALQANNLHGSVRDRMNLGLLMSLNAPVILHVSPPGQPGFLHWLVYLGVTPDGRIAVYDPPSDRGELTPAELLAIWDGGGIVVAIDPSGPGFPLPLFAVGGLVLTGISLVVARHYNIRPSRAIPLCIIVCAVTWHLAMPTGLLRNADAVSEVASRRFQVGVPEIDHTELRRLQLEQSALLVDARPVSAFEAGHIPDAINIPISSGLLPLKRSLSELPKDRPLVVYCLSDRCGWSDVIANQMIQHGYGPVFVYRNGYTDWLRREKAQK